MNLRKILIVGGGLSGSLLALRAIADPDNSVTLIERGARLGLGVAYPEEVRGLPAPALQCSAQQKSEV